MVPHSPQRLLFGIFVFGIFALGLLATPVLAAQKATQTSWAGGDGGRLILTAAVTLEARQTAQVTKLGGDLGALKYPQGIGVAADGTRYIVDSGNGRIVQLSAAGKPIKAWQASEPSDNQFQALSDLAFDAKGNIYVADGKNGTILKFSPGGEKLGVIGAGQLKGPLGLTVAPDGRIFVADTLEHKVAVFDASGKLLSKWGEEGTGQSQFRFPHDVALDAKNNVYVSDFLNDRIQVYTAEGRYVTSIGSSGFEVGQFHSPYSVVIDNTGRLWVSDSENARVQVLSLGDRLRIDRARVLQPPASGIDHPKGLAVTASGDVAIANAGMGAVDFFAIPKTR